MDAQADTSISDMTHKRKKSQIKSWIFLLLMLTGTAIIFYQWQKKEELFYTQSAFDDALQNLLTHQTLSRQSIYYLLNNISNGKNDFLAQKKLSENALLSLKNTIPETLMPHYEKLSMQFYDINSLSQAAINSPEQLTFTSTSSEYFIAEKLFYRTATQLKESMENNFSIAKSSVDQTVLACALVMLLCMIYLIFLAHSLIARLINNILKNNKIIEEKIETERKIQQHQKMEALSTLSGGIAHEFNNILAAIQGYTELVKMNKLLSEKDHIFLNNIHESSRRASRLVQQIMSFSQPGKNSRGLHHIHLVVEGALEMVKATLPNNINLVTSFDKLMSKIHVDVNEIRQVVINLCTNAWHAMESNGGALEVSLKEITIAKDDPQITIKPNRYIQLTVKDNGCGIDKELHTRIFEPFFTTKEVGEGTGLGLAVVHGIVQNHNGYIQLNSNPNQGSEFRILLPITHDHEDAVMDTTKSSINTRKGHILVVDDEPNLILLYQEALRKYGFQVTLFSDSRQALEAFKSHPEKYDILLTDHAMPYMTGKQLTKECKKIKPGIHIVMATAYGELIGHDEAKQLGIQDLLIKPVNSSTLISKIEQVLAAPV